MSSPESTFPPRRGWDRLWWLLATWFGCGRAKVAPGTVGTLGTLPLYFLVAELGPWAVFAAAVVLTALGILSADRVAKLSGRSDPQFVVIDEVAGVMLALAAAPHSPAGVALAVILFRVFDIWKPWPVRAVERRLPGGWGIVLDDVVAGGWAALGLALFRRLGWI